MSASAKSRKSVGPLQAEAARERLRRRYRPARVRILFVGEAPPASGRFFYQADSGLYRAVRQTFLSAFPELKRAEFLESFRKLDCYLVDLCRSPGRPPAHHAAPPCVHAGRSATGQDDSAAQSSTRCYGCSLHHSQRPTRTVSGKLERHSS